MTLALAPALRSTAYRYRNERLEIVWHTSVPTSDQEALDYFFAVTDFSSSFKPVYVERFDENLGWIMLRYKMNHLGVIEEVVPI